MDEFALMWSIVFCVVGVFFLGYWSGYGVALEDLADGKPIATDRFEVAKLKAEHTCPACNGGMRGERHVDDLPAGSFSLPPELIGIKLPGLSPDEFAKISVACSDGRRRVIRRPGGAK